MYVVVGLKYRAPIGIQPGIGLPSKLLPDGDRYVCMYVHTPPASRVFAETVSGDSCEIFTSI